MYGISPPAFRYSWKEKIYEYTQLKSKFHTKQTYVSSVASYILNL